MKAWKRFEQVVYMTDVKHEDLFDTHIQSMVHVYGPYREDVEAAFEKMQPVIDAMPDGSDLWSATDCELAKQQIIALMQKADV